MYVSDLVAGLIALMASNYHQPVNIGNPQEITVKQLAEIVLRLASNIEDPTGRLATKPPWQDDPKQRKPDITRAKKVLHWEPKIDFMDGIRQTIPYFKNELLLAKNISNKSEWNRTPPLDDVEIGAALPWKAIQGGKGRKLPIVF